MPRTGQPAIRRIAAVQRAVSVLDALASEESGLGTNEIARRTRINASTVSRLLATLTEAGLVEHVPDTGRYRLGLRLLELGNLVLGRLDLRRVARPHLEDLVALSGETATLSVPGDEQAITVDFVQSQAFVQSVARLGRPSVAHATAVGKVFLGHGGKLPAGPLRAFTDRTITDRRQLANEVERARERGFAEAVSEREVDFNAIAAPIFGAEGRLVAIIGIQGPAGRFDPDAMRRAAGPLVERAAQISRELGFREA